MNFQECINLNDNILMEGALGERLKREYGLKFDDYVAMAKLIYEKKGAIALSNLWNEYITIAHRCQLPFLATTPTRRANYECVKKADRPATIIDDNVTFLRNIQKNSGISF